MTTTDTFGTHTETTHTETERPPLHSVDLFAAGSEFGLPALVWAVIAASAPPLVSAVSLAGCALWVIVDLLLYRVRRGALPPRPAWRWPNGLTVPVFFAGGLFSAVQAF